MFQKKLQNSQEEIDSNMEAYDSIMCRYFCIGFIVFC